ncbi:MAG TPA: hypothetical protein P5234_15835 [Thermoanaerobaculaceae bacterium]|nr:hypothetical protein [Thermoanaerobaculaceae bacterium]
MSMQQAKMGPRVARGCVWCEPLGGNVTAAALLTEWGATLLARELAGIVAEAGAQRGGAAYLGKRDALADLGRRLDRDGDGAASRSLAAFLTEYRREDERNRAERLLSSLVALLPSALLADAVREALEMIETGVAR